MTIQAELRDVTGARGELFFELRLTDYEDFDRPLFRPGFLGDKWPAIDFYVELTKPLDKRLYFFAQVKATVASITSGMTRLPITAAKSDVERLVQIPGPTYLFGVHEPTGRVFVQAVHSRTPRRAIRSIALKNELTNSKLAVLHREVRAFWKTSISKPTSSVFT